MDYKRQQVLKVIKYIDKYPDKYPLVSVLMTAYNRESFIGEAIESVLLSSYKNWELIICDDGSTDATFQIATGYANNDSRIRVFKNEKNLGDYPNRNHTASFAKGEYIVNVDSDDWMIADSLIKWVSIMKEKNSSFGIFCYSRYAEPILLKPAVVIQEHFFKGPILSFGPIASIIKTSYFKSIKGFPEKYGPANDMYYNLKAASGTYTMLFPFPLVNYRIHEGQELNNKYAYLYNNYRYLRDALQELDLSLSEKQKDYISHKNKRRFIVNIVRYLIKTKELNKTLNAIRLSGFRLKDVKDAIINKSKKDIFN